MPDRVPDPADVADPDRLAALASYAILDTPPEKGFDDLVAIAAEALGAPMALVSFVGGDRQWFKARIGLNAKETPIDRSVCAHALSERETLIIPDLTEDPRTRANRLVVDEPHLRFYAGAVLRSPEGHALGTLCVLDVKPRPEGVTAGQERILKALGRQVEAQLALRRAIASGDEAIRRYQLVGHVTHDAIWDWDLLADQVNWNEALTSAYGHRLEDVAPTSAWWMDHIHPDDRRRVSADIHAFLNSDGAEWRSEYRFRRVDGSYAMVLDRGTAVRDAQGGAVRAIGAMLDLTERAEAEEQFRALFEGANVGIVQLDPVTARALRVNDKLCEIWGASKEEILGQSVARWTPDEDDHARRELHGRLARGELMTLLLEKRYRRGDGRIIWARVNLVSRRLAGGSIQTTAMIEDVTAEREEKACKAALAELGVRMRDQRDERVIAGVACEVIGRTLGLSRVSFGTVDPRLAEVEVKADWRAGDLESGVGVHALDRFGDLAQALVHDDAFAVSDVAADPRTAGHAADYAAIGIRAMLHVPIRERGNLASVFFLHAANPRDWTTGAVAFVRMAADQAAAAAARALSEERQRILNQELSHRMKNLLALVQAIASQTMRGASTIEGASRVLEGRLVALGRAHDLLLGGAVAAAPLETVVVEALKSHLDGPERLRVEGPEVLVGQKAALPLVLMMHELGTNAAKYGALSSPAGVVSVTWALAGALGRRIVRLVWAESGGPEVEAPTRRGFGVRLLERGLANQLDGEVRLDYAPTGVVCTLDVPLERLQDQS